MAGIERVGARLTIAEQLSRRPEFRNRPLALELRDQVSGRILRASEALAAGVKGIGSVVASAASRALAIIKPEMVTSERISFNIMKKPVTVEMFRQFAEDSKYKIVGHNARKLIALLADPKKSDQILNYVSHEDATAFVAWRKEKTGQDLRMPTGEEWMAARYVVRDQLTGHLWEWTQTNDIGKKFLLLCMFIGLQVDRKPGFRYDDSTVRLVEGREIKGGE